MSTQKGSYAIRVDDEVAQMIEVKRLKMEGESQGRRVSRNAAVKALLVDRGVLHEEDVVSDQPEGSTAQEDNDGPRLGLATTEELIAELVARAEVSVVNGEAWPLYRTVDSE